MDNNFLARLEECLLMCDPKGLQVSGPNMKVTAYFGAPALLSECEVEIRNLVKKQSDLLIALKAAQGFIEQAIEVGGFGEYTLGVVNDAIRKVEEESK